MLRGKESQIIVTIVVATSIFLFFSQGGWALGYGGSNLNYLGYPSFNSFEPSPPLFNPDEYQMRRYKDDVESYIDEAERYVENAKNDIRNIEEEIRQAIRKANSVVDEYNAYVSRRF